MPLQLNLNLQALEWSETPVYMQLLYVLVLIRKNSGVLYLDLFKNQTEIYIGSP